MARLAAAEVLAGLYDAVADHTQFDGMLKAMDDFLDADPEGLEAGQSDWKTMFRQHFGRAGRFVTSMDSQDEATPILFVDKQIVPAAVVNSRLDVVASNALFDGGLFGDDEKISLSFTTPSDQRRFEELLKSNEVSAPVLVSFTLPGRQTPIFAVAANEQRLSLLGQPGPLITIKVAKATWNPDLVPLLEQAYGLTLAEIGVLEALVELGVVTEVAAYRARSVRTVRTQLTHIYAKLGLSSQTELALFLATLTQLMTKQKRPSDIGIEWSNDAGDEIERCVVSHNGCQTAYVKYGAPSGIPVLMIHSTTPPEMIPRFRAHCRETGIQVIAVHKPGSGGSTPRDSKEGPAAMVHDYAAILAQEGLGPVLVAGHCSGGLYALAFADKYPDIAKGVILIDAGLPFKGRRELMSLPKSLRRTFLPARYIPEVLLVPHRIFASNFKRSAAGEARVVDYFFQDNVVDQNLTRTDRTYYEITRQIIEYSFQDVDRLVADVCRWARDWSGQLDRVSQKPVTFIHGRENKMFVASKIETYVAQHENAGAIICEGAGQLQLYQHPEGFSEAVLSISQSA